MDTKSLMDRLIIALIAYRECPKPANREVYDSLRAWVTAEKGEEYGKYIRRDDTNWLSMGFQSKFPTRKYKEVSDIMAIRGDVQEYIEGFVMCKVNRIVEDIKRYNSLHPDLPPQNVMMKKGNKSAIPKLIYGLILQVELDSPLDSDMIDHCRRTASRLGYSIDTIPLTGKCKQCIPFSEIHDCFNDVFGEEFAAVSTRSDILRIMRMWRKNHPVGSLSVLDDISVSQCMKLCEEIDPYVADVVKHHQEKRCANN